MEHLKQPCGLDDLQGTCFAGSLAELFPVKTHA
jgi:hypothetical protein